MPFNFIYLLFLCTAILSTSITEAQDPEEEINVAGLRLLDYDNSYLPAGILQKRSVVFVSVPPVSSNSSERGDWQAYSAEAHEYFKKIGIDPVAYYYLDDVIAGPDASVVCANQIREREVSYIIILSKVLIRIGGNTETRHVMLITDFNKLPTFISNGQKAWKDQNKDLEKVMKNIYRLTIRQEFKKTNNLIIDQPEIFGGISIISARRSETYPSDLRVDKLAVPRFVDYRIPADYAGNSLNKRIVREIEESNKANERNNFAIDRIFDGYSYQYELVDYNKGEEELYKDGFQYVLLRLNSSGYSIREMLGYQVNPSETDYITMKKKPDGTLTLRTIPVNAPVHKFYIKHLYRKEIYVGETWDADETWEEALTNFINNLKEKLGR